MTTATVHETPVQDFQIMDRITTGKTATYRGTLLYGPHGVGKSHWGSLWPKPLFLSVEDGVRDLDVASVKISNYADFRAAILQLGSPHVQHDYQTIVIDSIDWAEQFMWRAIAKAHGKDAVSEIPYGAGYKEAAEKFLGICQAFSQIRQRCHVVLLAHCEIKRFESPTGDSYDRYQPKLHEKASAIIQEWADEVLFMSYDVRTVAKDEGFGRKRTVGLGDGARVLRTSERPSHLAKNRLGLPDEIPVIKDEFTYGQYLTTEVA